MTDSTPNRRHFIASMAGMAGLAATASVAPLERAGASVGLPRGGGKGTWDDSWTTRLGQHRVVFDHSELDQQPGAWVVPDVMDAFHDVLGTTDKDLGIVLVLRHRAVPLFLNDVLWDKYELGKSMDKDAKGTDFPRANPMREHVKALQQRGVTVLGCNRAIVGLTGRLVERVKGNPDEVKKEVLDNIFPGVALLPNGLYALARAQGVGCAFMR